MNLQEQELFTEYKISRDNIQLIDAYIVDLQASRVNQDQNWEGECEHQLKLATRLEKGQEGQVHAYLKAEITVRLVDPQEVAVQVVIVCRGEFQSERSLKDEELLKLVSIQAVPQLIPYIRTAVSNLSAIMGTPVAINIPTMDIIKSIGRNRAESSMEG